MILITVTGRLAHQPEVKMGRQTNFCEFRLLSTRFARGEEHTEAVTFICFGEEAEHFCEVTEKGQLIEAAGTQETYHWTDNHGQARTNVKYQLRWWQSGPKANRSRQQEAPRQQGRTPQAEQRPPAPTASPSRPPRNEGRASGDADGDGHSPDLI